MSTMYDKITDLLVELSPFDYAELCEFVRLCESCEFDTKHQAYIINNANVEDHETHNIVGTFYTYVLDLVCRNIEYWDVSEYISVVTYKDRVGACYSFHNNTPPDVIESFIESIEKEQLKNYSLAKKWLLEQL